MNIDDSSTIAVGLCCVLAANAVLALFWDRIRLIGRAALVGAVLLSVTATAGLELNRLTETYPNWSALVGEEPAEGPAPAPAAAVPDDTGAGVEPAPPAPGKGRIVTYTVTGPASRMSMPMSVYLPAAYFTPEGRRLDFPVIEALHGYPGTPTTWIRRLAITGRLDAEIAAGRMAPTVVLMPYQTPDRLLDTECTNLVGGPQAETYVTTDVPAWARTYLRVRTDRAAWGLTGFSAGAFCAMNLLLRHPGQYAAAAGMSGYSGPGIRVGDHSENTTNDIAWRLTHLPRPAAALWIGWAADDIDASNGSRRIAGLAGPPLSVVTATVPHGGHSHAVWQQMEGPAFDWLSAHLARPAPHVDPPSS